MTRTRGLLMEGLLAMLGFVLIFVGAKNGVVLEALGLVIICVAFLLGYRSLREVQGRKGR